MKKSFYLFNWLLAILLMFSGVCTLHLYAQNPVSHKYDPEDDLIEVMFIETSRVRMRDGQLTDLISDALAGVGNYLQSFQWHQWTRISDVDEALIDKWAQDGKRNTGLDLYNLNNIYRLRIPKGNDIWEVAASLEAMPGIYLARPVPKPMPLPQGNYEPQQGYLQSAGNTPTGIDAYNAWNFSGGTGTGITICDIEYSWNYDHEDVTKAYGSQINTNVADPFSNNDHGTSVIGVLVSDNNGWGTTGICYNSNLLTCGSYYGSSPTWNVPGAIILAISHLSAGDIILLEQQWDYTGSNSFIPIEWWLNYSPSAQTNNGVYAAIVTAIANGIHVVQAGGNGNINTDLLLWYGNSGSIIVGAGGVYPGGTYIEGDLERLSFSSYGQRFDLQGWGENVVTTGYGDLYSGGGVNKYFTSTFSGTSSASPVVAGAVACYQGYYMANISPNPLSPLAMRQHLVTYGTPQIFGPAGHIGPRPDLNLAILNLPAQQDELDFGDAPDYPYPTLLASNGARHLITPTLYLGALIDSEPDGLPGNFALSDDQAGVDDEDGVIFKNSLVAGQTLNLEIIVNGNGFLNAWVDLDGNGSWSDPGEHIINDLAVVTGKVFVNVPVPSGAMHGFTYARFRLSSQSGLGFMGYADDGEVEDYRVLINPPMDHKMHYPQYPNPNGWDVNFTSPARIGDDWQCSQTGYVEDFHFWVSFKDDMIPPGFGVSFEIRIYDDIPAHLSPSGYSMPGNQLWFREFNPGSYNYEFAFEHPQGWYDPYSGYYDTWNHNQCFRIDIFNFDDPFMQEEGNIYWLVITANVMDPDCMIGWKTSLDHFNDVALWEYLPSVFTWNELNDPITNEGLSLAFVITGDGGGQEELDFGDAPVPYPTTLAQNGARHAIIPAMYLGQSVDSETDGQPDPFAMGDDMDGNDDEDGVIFRGSFVPGQTTLISFSNVAGAGFLNAWFDWNNNGSWADPGEHVFTDVYIDHTLPPSLALSCPVPLHAVPGLTFARFRYSSAQGLNYNGHAPDGEVEDYRILINAPEEHKMHFPQFPDPGGWDVNMTFPHRIGDDWMCTETGFVEDFHFWVSWKGDMVPEDFGVIFEIRIFNDIPADPDDPFSYSKPGAILWERDFGPDAYAYEWVFEHPQGWYDPFLPEYNIWDHYNCYRIDIDNFDQPFLQQKGTIYWLVITAQVPGGGGGVTQLIVITLDNIDPLTPPYQTWVEAGAVLSMQDHPATSPPVCNYNIVSDGIWMFPAMLEVDLSGIAGKIIQVEVDIVESHIPNSPESVEAILYDNATIVDSRLSQIGFILETLVLNNPGGVFNPDKVTVSAFEGAVFEIRLILEDYFGQEFKIGWKTSPDHFMDVAVWEDPMITPPWAMLHDPVNGEALSLSFIITGDPLPDELMDYGDAPAPYPTTFAQDGARHIIVPGMHLGTLIDAEQDGQPNFLAAGDDLNNLQDEDGVKFLNAFVQGQNVNVEITSNGAGYVNAWFDWNNNGSWADPGEHAIVDYAVVAGGVVTIAIPVPGFAMPGMTYTRFRLSSLPGLSYFGQADDGEVEDYRILIQEPAEHKMHYPQYPKSDGYNVEFWSQLADDFMCSATGPIRFIRFWISYTQNLISPTGSFRIKICEDIPAVPGDPFSYSMPGDTLWARTFNPGDYEEVMMEYSWQSWLNLPYNTGWSHYDHFEWNQITIQNIEEPFIQTKDEIYWLVIDFGEHMAFKGWKESAEPQYNDAAVFDTVFTIHGWRPLHRPHDMQPIDFAFIIDDMIPDDLTLQNITVTGGQTECYEAQSTITTGGSGTTFIVQNNAIVHLIAGHSISMLPGTHFQSGSQVHAYIDLSGEFCTNPKAIVVEEEPVPEILPFEFADKDSFFRVYPNPNTGQFTLELREVSDHAVISVEIFSLIGESVMKLDLPEMKQYLFDLSARQPGIYLIRVMRGDKVGVEKVIKH